MSIHRYPSYIVLSLSLSLDKKEDAQKVDVHSNEIQDMGTPRSSSILTFHKVSQPGFFQSQGMTLCLFPHPSGLSSQDVPYPKHCSSSNQPPSEPSPAHCWAE